MPTVADSTDRRRIAESTRRLGGFLDNEAFAQQAAREIDGLLGMPLASVAVRTDPGLLVMLGSSGERTPRFRGVRVSVGQGLGGRALLERRPVAAPLRRRRGNAMTENGSATRTPARVLVVDDHPIVIDGVRRILAETSDLQLLGEATDPASAESQARLLRPDIVILDLKLGNHLATPLCRTLLSISPSSTVVIHTAFDDPEPLRACLNAGATGIVLKGTRDLVEALRTVLAGNVFVDPSLTDLPAERAQNLPGRNGCGVSLTTREYEVLCIMALGRTSKEIAEELHLAENTVRSYVQSLLQKLQARNRIEALAKARHLRLL